MGRLYTDWSVGFHRIYERNRKIFEEALEPPPKKKIVKNKILKENTSAARDAAGNVLRAADKAARAKKKVPVFISGWSTQTRAYLSSNSPTEAVRHHNLGDSARRCQER